MNGRKPDFDKVVRLGNDVLSIPRPAENAGVREVMTELSQLQDLWNELVRLLNERQGQLTSFFTKSQLYYHPLSAVETWLGEVEKRLEPLESTAVTPAAIQHQAAVAEVRINDP